MFNFDPPRLADHSASFRDVLAYIPPRGDDDVRLVAAGLKTWGELYEPLFLDWAKSFGRYKAKQLWAKTKADPDALEEVALRHLQALEHRKRFQPLTAAELALRPAPEYRIKGVLPAQGLAVIYGASASGKSFLATAFAAAIAEGEPIFDCITSPAPVLYVGLEGEAGYRGRALAWQRHNGRQMSDGVRFLLQPFRLSEATDVADLAQLCPPGCAIFVDTLNRAAPAIDENSSKDMGVVIDRAKQLQAATGGVVVLIAHTGKDPTKGLRGHSSLFAAIDAAILVSREGDARRWKVDKAKDGKDGIEFGFRLHIVKLGIDVDGDPVSSCVVVPDPTAVGQEAKPLSGNRQLAHAMLHKTAPDHGVLAADGSFKGVPVEAWRAAFYEASTADNDAAKRKAFGRARADLIEMGMIAVEDEHYRFDGANAEITNQLIASNLAGQRHNTGTLA
jgi:hypothetical protein